MDDQPHDASSTSTSTSGSQSSIAQPRSRSTHAQVLGTAASVCTAVAVLVGVTWFVTVGNQPAVKKPHVLIVSTTDDEDEAFPVSAFDQALERGGQVTVRFEDLRSEHPEIEEFTPDRDGSYLTFGALVNFIASRGWHYHSRELNGMIVFVR